MLGSPAVPGGLRWGLEVGELAHLLPKPLGRGVAVIRAQLRLPASCHIACALYLVLCDAHAAPGVELTLPDPPPCWSAAGCTANDTRTHDDGGQQLHSAGLGNASSDDNEEF